MRYHQYVLDAARCTQPGMSNQLAIVPFVELAREIHQRKLTGALRLSQERQKIALYFDEGAFTAAATNLRPFRLAKILIEHRLCTPEQIAAAGGSELSDAQLAKALIAQHALTPAVSADGQRLLMREIFRYVANWRAGEWEFAPRVRPAEPTRIALALPPLLLEPARSVDYSQLAAVLQPATVTTLVSSPPTADLSLLPLEGFVLSRLLPQQTVAQIINDVGLPPEQVLCALYTLSLADMLTLNPPLPARIDENRAAQAYVRSPSVETVAATVSPLAEVSGAAPGAAAPVKSGAVMNAPNSPAPDDKFAASSTRSLQAQLDVFLFRLREAENYYQILGVPTDADTRAVKHAYHALARSYHPDKFRALEPEIHTAADNAFAQATKAYHTLSDEKLRATYNRRIKLTANEPAPVSPTVNPSAPPSATAADKPSAAPASGEEQYRTGTEALRRGNIGAAIEALRIAVAQQPARSQYRLQYARALSYDKSRLRDAALEIEKVIEDSGRTAEAHLLLAEVYQKSGMKIRARAEAEKALESEPSNAEARALLHELRDAVLKK